MMQPQQQQKPDVKQEELAPFPNLPSQVSSASSLNSNASTNASTLPSSLQQHEVHEGAAAQLGMTDLNRQITEPIQNTTSATMLNQNTATSSTTTTTPAVGGLLLSNNTINPNYNATAAALASASIVSGTVPEFLYQLTKMLTDPNNEIIEWSTYSGNGRIEVHNPSRLESEVLSRYFRHSKYSSFQRQLNYFGFRKIAGKGKMSPCSYVNDAATLDIRSLLLMKRKGSEKDKKGSTSSTTVAATASSSTGGGGNNKTNALSSSTKLSGSKRVNPGNDIQPATVQPMFQQSHRNISFDTMAATVARNIADVKQQQLQHQQQLQLQRQQQQQQQQSSNSNANSEFDVVKRTKLESSTSAPLGYTVATGKGVRHQLNGYLRSSSSGGSINNTNTTATTTTTAASSSSQNESWLVHPSSNKASSAPAPLQFLDPNELGMSVASTSYLNQLKNNFAAEVAASGRVDTAPAPSASSGGAATTTATEVTSSSESLDYPTTTDSSSGNGSTTTTSANTSSVSRVSSQSSFLGMLRRDDSLINLAMLPTLDSTASFNNHPNNNSDKNTSTGGSNNGNDFGFIDYNPS